MIRLIIGSELIGYGVECFCSVLASIDRKEDRRICRSFLSNHLHDCGVAHSSRADDPTHLFFTMAVRNEDPTSFYNSESGSRVTSGGGWPSDESNSAPLIVCCRNSFITISIRIYNRCTRFLHLSGMLSMNVLPCIVKLLAP
jgi:hypothetical protein